MRELSGKLRLEYVQYQELLQMTQLRTNLSSEAEGRLRRGETITTLLVQDKHQPAAMEDQIMQLYALKAGVLDEFSSEQVKRFKREFGSKMREWYPQFTADLRKAKKLTPDLKKTLEECLKRYVHELVTEGTR